jgi:hypothetical protein
MKNRIRLNQNDSRLDELIPFVLLFVILILFDSWLVKILIGSIMLFVFFSFIKLEAYLDMGQKEIIVQKILFKKVTFSIMDIIGINFNETSNPMERDSVVLEVKNKGVICGCFNMKDEEYNVLFNEIYDNADLKKLTWNKKMEGFEPFVKSKFGAIIKN